MMNTRNIALVLVFLFTLLSFRPASAQLGDEELRQIKGKVVDEQKTPIPDVLIKDLYGNQLDKTDKKGVYIFNSYIPLRGNKPVFVFSKEDYISKKWKYDALDRDVIITLIKTQKEESIVIESIIKENNDPIIQKKKSNPKTQQIAKVSEPTAQQETSSSNDKNPNNKQLIKELKEQVAYLESLLLQEGVTLSKDSSARSTHYKKLQQQIGELKGEIAVKEQELQVIKVELKYLWLILVALLLIIIPTVLSVIFYRNNRKTKGMNIVLQERLDLIQTQKEEISTQRDNIVAQNNKLEIAYRNIRSSILYAQKIQESILINPNELNSHFNDAFIYYKPKDIVSGDFYWFSVIEDKIILAAADCTGHGVPGAFMTMLGNSFLNEIVNKSKVTDPAEILTQLHEMVSLNLRQQDKDSAQDGMDISLVVLDQKNKNITFAGANNPFYYINQDTITQVKATRRGIGGDNTDRSFTNTIIPINEVGTFYLVSDGFQDQFDKNDSKKYMKKRFREFLESISSFTADEQKQKLDNELSTWKGHCEQTDDVLVIGVKL
jgi:serine phosphatase RsbU (regulator of sigma subunit)